MKIDIGISEDKRSDIAQGLCQLLADTYTLYLKTHFYHWNVTGPLFQTFHLLFEQQYTELWNAVDLVAERIRALGRVAPGSHAKFTPLTTIKEAVEVPRAMDMVQDLLLGHETIARTSKSILRSAESGNDQATADLITQRIQLHEKTAWMLRSILDGN